MTSRRLWLLVSLLAVPLLIAANTGCDVVFGLKRLSGINAYTCACTCNPGPRERVVALSARADDADERRSTGSVLLGGSTLRMTTDFLAGARFAALGIPQGATILSAYVQFTAGQSDAAAATVAIRVQDVDDAAAFTTGGFDISSRPTPAPPVSWTSPAWTNNDQGPAQQTEDLAALIQSVVSRPAWTDTSSLVLLFDATSGGRIAVSFDGAGNRAPVLHLAYYDPTADVTATLPVCLPEESNPNLTPGAPNPEADGPDGDSDPDVFVNDCTGRVENTYKDLVGACGYISNPSTNCDCQLVPSGYHDQNKNGQQDTGEGYFGFIRETCDHGPPVCEEEVLNLPADPTDPARCNNFDPQGLADCVEQRVAFCDQNSIPRDQCDTDDCLAKVAATNAPNDDPVCIAHASAGPEPLAFQMFGRRTTCEVTGTSHIEVGTDHREPQQDPLTRGTLEIFGGPCPGQSCAVGVSTQLAMNPITFSVKFARDPTFTDLIQGGNSGLTAASLDGAGGGVLPEHSTTAVARGRRGDRKEAIIGSNGTPVDLAIDWAAFTCSLNGNLGSSVDAEDVDGTCDGDDATLCRASSPDCDAVGGPCVFPTDPEPFVVTVALSGTLTNQPPTANAGNDHTVECTSPAGATFDLDGTQSSDPDDAIVGHDIRIVSWRNGSRTGPEVGFAERVPVTLGVGASKTYVLRVIDGYAQADEDAVNVAVVDTTPPSVFCNAPPTIVPPNKPVSFKATATDLCTATTIVPQLTSLECFTINGAGKRIDLTESCKVTLAGDTITISNTGGVAQHITWTAGAVDGAGNLGQVACEVEVANPGKSS